MREHSVIDARVLHSSLLFNIILQVTNPPINPNSSIEDMMNNIENNKPPKDASAAEVATFAVAMMSLLEKSESVIKEVTTSF